MATVSFSFLIGDVNWVEHSGKWISQKFNNGEFDYYLVRQLINMDEAYGSENEGQPKYHCQLNLIAPSEFNDLEAAVSCSGMDWEIEEMSDREKVEAISEYQGGALLWQNSGNNYPTLFKECQEQATIATVLTGFYLDKPQNRLGDSGWNTIKGVSVTDSWGEK